MSNLEAFKLKDGASMLQDVARWSSVHLSFWSEGWARDSLGFRAGRVSVLRRRAEGLAWDWLRIAEGLVSLLKDWPKQGDVFVWVFGQLARDWSVSTLALYNIRRGKGTSRR